MSLALISDDRYLEHDEASHPENANRLRAIHAMLQDDPALLDRLAQLAPRPADDAEICAAHERQLLDRLSAIADSGGGWVDQETYITPQSVEIARLAAGGALVAVDAVLAGQADQAFALIRPPGHHATPDKAMGFCLFNNAAIAAEFARSAYGLERVAIIDWDVHHGNGTQDIFAANPHVLYISTHGWPLWPGSGNWREMGERHGEGSTLNLPLRALTGDMGFHRAFSETIGPALQRFKPELVIISAGYDAHLQDPLGNLALSTAGYANLAAIVYNLAGECCDGRLVGLLEGGYNLDALASSVKVTLQTWLDNGHQPPLLSHDISHMPEPDVTWLINALKHDHPLLRG